MVALSWRRRLSSRSCGTQERRVWRMQVVWLVGSAGVTRGGLFDSAVDGSGSGEVKREKGAESLGRGSRMEA
jgi:hypothetical protein